ncbi:MAG TPA: YbaK/EbsC family protein, partial [Deltaproteobacteria bacterium]|nr:YbaK/EbsC family protein [Deltaproteobacteria bacterium]
MKQSLSSTAANYQDYIKSRGIEGKVVELPDSTRTAAEAAFAIGCEIAEIAKSVVFYVKDTHRPVLVIASGINRVDEKKLKKIIGGKLKRADADFVREATGFAI